MDIQSVNTLLEIKALQGLGDKSTTSNTANTDGFATLLQDTLAEATSEQLGSESTNSDTETSYGSNYLSQFLYRGHISTDLQQFVPVNNSTRSTSPISQTIDFTGQKATQQLLAGAEHYQDLINKAAETYGLPEKLIAAVMKKESNFNPNVVSTAGAVGLMQLMPATAKYIGVSDRTDPEQNIMGGAKYLRQMLDQFDTLELALAAYNAGPGNVKKYGGIPPFKETTNYVKKVLEFYNA